MICSCKTEAEFVSHLSALNWRGGDLLQEYSLQFSAAHLSQNIASLGLMLVASRDGQLATVQDSNNPQDYSRRSDDFDFHTDGLYRELVPDFVLLYCQSAGSLAIETWLADTRLALSRLSSSDRGTLRQLDLVYLDREDHAYCRNLLRAHPYTGEVVTNVGARAFVRPRVRSDCATPTLRESSHAVQQYLDCLTNSVVLKKRWQQGDVLLFDNNTYVHARVSRGQRDAERVLWRLWLSLGK